MILAAYAKWGRDCLSHLRGMFAFAFWDGDGCSRRAIASALSRSITPWSTASSISPPKMKALLPVPARNRDRSGRARRVHDVPVHDRREDAIQEHSYAAAGPCATVENGAVRVFRYWDVHYDIDWDHTPRWFGSGDARAASTIPSVCICALTFRWAPISRAVSIPA